MQYETPYYDLHIFNTHATFDAITGERIIIDPSEELHIINATKVYKFNTWQALKEWADETKELPYIYYHLMELENLTRNFWQLRKHIQHFQEA